MRAVPCVIGMIVMASLCSSIAVADDQTKPGAGNAAAAVLASQSPIVQSAYRFVLGQAGKIKNDRLAGADSRRNRKPEHLCAPSARLTEAEKDAIVQSLVDAGLLNLADGASITGGAKAASSRRCYATAAPARSFRSRSILLPAAHPCLDTTPTRAAFPCTNRITMWPTCTWRRSSVRSMATRPMDGRRSMPQHPVKNRNGSARTFISMRMIFSALRCLRLGEDHGVPMEREWDRVHGT